jgi:hypothetical protein
MALPVAGAAHEVEEAHAAAEAAQCAEAVATQEEHAPCLMRRTTAVHR